MMDFNIMAAMCDNRGIGLNNGLPWPSLSKDYKYYMEMTSRTNNKDTVCVNIRGRRTWLSTGEEEKRRDNVMNIVISKNPGDITGDPYVHKVFGSFDGALQYVSSPEEAVHHRCCRRVYLTRIYGQFEYDTVFPEFESNFDEVSLLDIEKDMQEEKGIRYQFKVYEKRR